MYAVSFSLLGGEYVMSVFGITMVNMDGDPINSELLQIIDSDEINRTTTKI